MDHPQVERQQEPVSRVYCGWRIAALLFLLVAPAGIAGCTGDDAIPRPGRGEASPAGEEQSYVATLEARGGWILPPEGGQWTRSRMLAILILPLESDPASLRVELNGRERTAEFLPAGRMSRRWRARADEMRAGQSDGASGGPATGSMPRVQAILDSRDMLMGDNLLQAWFMGPDGQVIQQQLHFSFRPGGRTIRCLVSRVTRRGENTASGLRLVVTPLDGAPAVDLSQGSSHPLSPWSVPRRRSFIIARAGEAEFYLPDGRYRIVATGGLLDGLDIWETPLKGDAEHRFVVRRQVELPGTVAVDFHVHAAPSIDSVLPLRDQLAAFQAAGVDLLVATDHSIVTDYRPLIASLSHARGHIRSLPGVEILLPAGSGDGLGHWNVWPLVPDAEAPPVWPGQITSFGALAVPNPESLHSGTPVADMFDAYRRQAARLAEKGQDEEIPAGMVPIIQLNHPRGFKINPRKNAIARRNDWFNKAGYLPGGPWPESFTRESAEGTLSLDFDAPEIWNRSSRRLYEEVRSDWFTFLNHGVVRTATANSDSHTLSKELAGYPLNIVLLPAGRPDGPQVEVVDLVMAVRSGRVIGTDGPVPLLTVRSSAGSAGPGETLQATDGQVRVRLEVLAADWVPVGEIRLWVNGQVAARGTGDILETTLHLPRDSWLVGEVGDLEGVPEETVLPGLYGELVPRGLALGFTNPVFVDVDGNGRYDASGGLP